MTVTSIKDAWISYLGNRLEVNLPGGKSVNIWIQAPAEATTSDSTEETEDDGSATKEERRETAKRIQRLPTITPRNMFVNWTTKSARTPP